MDEAVIKRDTSGIHAALRSMGFIAHGREAEVASERIVEYFHPRFQNEVRLESLNFKDIKFDPHKGFEKLIDLRRQDISIRELASAFQVPKDWVLLERTSLLMSSVCKQLDPEMNPIAVIRPYMEECVFGGDRDFATLVLNAVKDAAMSTLAMPADVHKYLAKAVRGDIEMRFRGISEAASLIYSMGHQLIYAMFSLVAGVLAVFFWWHGRARPLGWAGGIAAFFFACLLGSILWAWRYRGRGR